MDRRSALLAPAAAALLALLAACAQPAKRTQGQAFWSGRLALRVEGNEKQSFSAAFELVGAAAQGTLTLFSPLGSTLAHIEWHPGGALLRSGEETRNFNSLDELLESTTGSPLPVRALFDWLSGIDTALAGWRTDLAGLPDGRLTAQRLQPAPVLHLRLVLDQSGMGQPKATP